MLPLTLSSIFGAYAQRIYSLEFNCRLEHWNVLHLFIRVKLHKWYHDPLVENMVCLQSLQEVCR